MHFPVKKELRRLGMLVMAALTLLMLPAALPEVTHAGSDISATNVTALTIDKGASAEQPITNWAVLSVHLEFSEDAEGAADIRDGDTIRVSWPTKNGNGDAYLAGQYQTDIPVKLQGSDTVIATAKVTSGGAVITFNKEVEQYQHVKGYLNFKAQVIKKNSSDSTSQAVIESGRQSQTVYVKDSGSSPTKFSSKSGKFAEDENGGTDYTKASWWIVVNRNAAQVTGPVKVVDKMPKALSNPTFTDVSVYCQYGTSPVAGAGGDGKCRKFLQELGVTISYDTSNSDYNTLTLTFPASAFSRNIDGTETPVCFAFTLSTEVDQSKLSAGRDENNSTPVRNNLETTYTIKSETETTETTSSTLRIYYADAGAEGVPKGMIRITKVVDGTTVPIEGVTFKVEKLDGENGSPVSGWYEDTDGSRKDSVSIKTDTNGIAELANLDDGYYQLTEVAAESPDWVVATTQKVQVHLQGDTGSGVTISNRIRSTDITAQKVWQTADGSADLSVHPTIYFKLYRAVSGGEPQPVDTELKKLENGVTTAVWSDLPETDEHGNAYTYSVVEVDENGNDFVPDGYTKKEDGLTVTNTRETTSISAFKTWLQSDGETPDTDEHPTIWFKLYRTIGDQETAEEVPGAEIKQLENGTDEVTWTDLPTYICEEGSDTPLQCRYSVRETDENGEDFVPQGFTKLEDGLTVTNTRKPSKYAPVINPDQTSGGSSGSKKTAKTTKSSKNSPVTTASADSGWSAANNGAVSTGDDSMPLVPALIAGAALCILLLAAGARKKRT